MFELNRVGEHTYYIDSAANVGVYEYGGKVCLIDSGSDSDAAKRILALIEGQGWALDKVFCTHAHADHSGGTAYLKRVTGCGIFSTPFDAAVIQNGEFMPTYLFGGYPLRELRNRFIVPPCCECGVLTEKELPAGMEMTRLDGHDFEQTAFRTPDGVWFIADAVVSPETLKKYRIDFLFDIEEHLRSLKKLETLEGRLFIPAHYTPIEDVAELARANAANVYDVAGVIKRLCRDGLTIDELLERIFAEFGIKLYLMQYALVGFTTRSYLSWLCGRGEMSPRIKGTRLLWQTVE